VDPEVTEGQLPAAVKTICPVGEAPEVPEEPELPEEPEEPEDPLDPEPPLVPDVPDEKTATPAYKVSLSFADGAGLLADIVNVVPDTE
jgi:hypothetical protein